MDINIDIHLCLCVCVFVCVGIYICIIDTVMQFYSQAKKERVIFLIMTQLFKHASKLAVPCLTSGQHAFYHVSHSAHGLSLLHGDIKFWQNTFPWYLKQSNARAEASHIFCIKGWQAWQNILQSGGKKRKRNKLRFLILLVQICFQIILHSCLTCFTSKKALWWWLFQWCSFSTIFDFKGLCQRPICTCAGF